MLNPKHKNINKEDNINEELRHYYSLVDLENKLRGAKIQRKENKILGCVWFLKNTKESKKMLKEIIFSYLVV